MVLGTRRGKERERGELKEKKARSVERGTHQESRRTGKAISGGATKSR